jgi:hypothetical protein
VSFLLLLRLLLCLFVASLPVCSALASCPSITCVEVHEYASEQQEPFTPGFFELSQRIEYTSYGRITPAAATCSNAHCNWLPSLASCVHSQLQQLDMRLPAPLPSVQQPLLLQLTQLRMLSLSAAQNLVLGVDVS